jgi:MFS family permease
MGESTSKERFLLAATVLGFFADVISLASFVAGSVGPVAPIAFTIAFVIVLVVLVSDYRKDPHSYPFLDRVKQSVAESRAVGWAAFLIGGCVLGLLLAGGLAAVYMWIAKPEAQSASDRETAAMFVLTILAVGAGLGLLIAFVLRYMLAVMGPIFDLSESMSQMVKQGRVVSTQLDPARPFEERIILKDIKRTTKQTDEGLKVRVELLIENRGPATQVYPYAVFTVAELVGGKFVKKVVRSPASWVAKLEASTRTVVPHEWIFPGSTTVLVTKEPLEEKVGVRAVPHS